MDSLQFAYWLQGFCELNQQPPTPEQWKSIKEHLQLVFNKVTRPVNFPDPIKYRIPTTDLDPNVSPWTITCKVGQAANTNTIFIC